MGLTMSKECNFKDCLFVSNLEEIAVLLVELSERINNITEFFCGDCENCSENFDNSLDN